MAGAFPELKRYTVREYFGLVDCGLVDADDRVELLDGLIVASPQQNPPHAGVTNLVYDVLYEAIRGRAAIRVQLPFVAGTHSAPEPDVAVVPGHPSDYLKRHPDAALLIVEVTDRSLSHARITKAAIYAGANVPDYWIVDVRHQRVEIFRDPDPASRRYRRHRIARRGERLKLVGLAGVSVAVSEILPAWR